MSHAAPTLERIELTTGQTPQATVIWLHGLGADGNDFVPIVPELGLDEASCGAMRFVFPHAPVIPVTINGGFEMRAWYDILGADLVRREDPAGLARSQQAVAALIDQEQARGIAASRIVLAGFSQGCAMSLLTGLRYPQRLAGVIGLSGYLPLADSTAAQAAAANLGVPVLMAHGKQDAVVPLSRGQAARDTLTALGYPVEWHEYPMEHAVCPDEIDAIAGFLRRVLPRVASA